MAPWAIRLLIGTERDREVTDTLIGATWRIGVNTLRASYIMRNDKGIENADSRQTSLGVVHNFSKRTAAYATVAHFQNKNTAAYNFIASGFNPVAGGKATAIQAGISHTF